MRTQETSDRLLPELFRVLDRCPQDPVLLGFRHGGSTLSHIKVPIFSEGLSLYLIPYRALTLHEETEMLCGSKEGGEEDLKKSEKARI